MTPMLALSGVDIAAPGGRPLFAGLSLVLGREKVALVGRNGVGKSTLLAVLAGERAPDAGRVRAASRTHLVPQSVSALSEPIRTLPRSHGERRRLALREAERSGAEILLLDEPTEDLDEEAVAWLRSWLRAFSGCLVVASHDRRLLADFDRFFVASESGCRYIEGTLADVTAQLAEEQRAEEERYARGLRRLVEQEAHTLHVARRKARKKRYGRCSELDRATPRVRLNQKRDHAQVSHGRLAQVRAERLDAARAATRAARRALAVALPLTVPVPALPAGDGATVVDARGVWARAGDRPLFGPIDLEVRRDRVAVVGPNGAGKTTLLEILLGRRAPDGGTARRDLARVGSIAQGASDWVRDEPLATLLLDRDPALGPDGVATLLAAHRFPLALAARPLASLSPGERTRAALLCLFQRAPPIEALVLDEPTYSLDLVGQEALVAALRAWPGGLVVASHDRTFLAEIGVGTVLHLGAERGSG